MILWWRSDNTEETERQFGIPCYYCKDLVAFSYCSLYRVDQSYQNQPFPQRQQYQLNIINLMAYKSNKCFFMEMAALQWNIVE